MLYINVNKLYIMIINIIIQSVLAIYFLVGTFNYAYAGNDPAFFGHLLALLQTTHILIIDIINLRSKKRNNKQHTWIKKKKYKILNC